jgi:hypothetical protein
MRTWHLLITTILWVLTTAVVSPAHGQDTVTFTVEETLKHNRHHFYRGLIRGWRETQDIYLSFEGSKPLEGSREERQKKANRWSVEVDAVSHCGAIGPGELIEKYHGRFDDPITYDEVLTLPYGEGVRRVMNALGQCLMEQFKSRE